MGRFCRLFSRLKEISKWLLAGGIPHNLAGNLGLTKLPITTQHLFGLFVKSVFLQWLQVTGIGDMPECTYNQLMAKISNWLFFPWRGRTTCCAWCLKLWMAIAFVSCLYFMMKLGEMDNKPDEQSPDTEDNPDHEQ